MAIPVLGLANLIDYIQFLRDARNPANKYPEADYNRDMAAMQASMNTPEYMNRFEDTVRNENYGTVEPIAPWYVGPQTEDSERFKLGETMLPRRLDALPVESTFTPEQLDAIRQSMYGNAPEIGPQREEPFVMPGPGGDYMPQGGDKMDSYDAQQEYEQYLRGGLTGYRR